MSNFMSKYLDSSFSDEEIKKHGMTRRDLEFIKREYFNLLGMLTSYQSSIFNRRDEKIRIQEELEKAQMIADYFTFLGNSYGNFIAKAQSSINEIEGFYLERNLDYYHNEIIRLIIYLLSRVQREYEMSTIFHNEYYSDIHREKKVTDHFNLLLEKDEKCPCFHSFHDILPYIEFLCEKQKSFILTGLDTCYNDDSFDKLFSPLLEHSPIAYLGKGRWKTLCLIGDDTFREVIMKLMLFSDAHGLSLSDFSLDKRLEYAQAIESMDISSYFTVRRSDLYLALVKKDRTNK